MKINRIYVLPFITVLSCIAVSVPGVATGQGGTINFVGAIVEPVCSVGTVKNRVTLACDQQGKTVSQTLNMHQLESQSPKAPAIQSVAMRWIDDRQKTGVLTVTYR